MSSVNIAVAQDAAEEKATAYQQEWRSTLAFGAAYVLLAHTGIFAILTGYGNDIRVLGFPLHYFVAIVAGSVGVLIVSILWNRYADRLEEAIREEDLATTPDINAFGALSPEDRT